MTLEDVIADELHSGMAHTLISDGHYTAASKSIANAVRAFLGSEEVVDAMASEMWNDEFMRATGRVRLVSWADAANGEHDRYRRLARSALSSIGGE